MYEPSSSNWITEIVIVSISIVLAFFGGVVKHLANTVENKEDGSISLGLIHGIIGGFVGSLVSLYMISNGFDELMVLAASGFAGCGGVVLLRYMLRITYRKIDPNFEESTKKDGGE